MFPRRSAVNTTFERWANLWTPSFETWRYRLGSLFPTRRSLAPWHPALRHHRLCLDFRANRGGHGFCGRPWYPPPSDPPRTSVETRTPRTWGAGRLAPQAEARFVEGADYCGRFFKGQAEAQLALYRLAAILEADGFPYAIIGAFALNEYGHKRVTVGVDLVMREEHLSEFKRRYLGKGYAERVPGTGKLLDTLHGVNIDVLSTGRFPGDDKPKPIAFPDPATVALRGERFALLPMARFLELKLASGMVAAHRAKDLVDFQELIKSAGLPANVADDLHPWVREKFLELWQLAQVTDPF